MLLLRLHRNLRNAFSLRILIFRAAKVWSRVAIKPTFCTVSVLHSGTSDICDFLLFHVAYRVTSSSTKQRFGPWKLYPIGYPKRRYETTIRLCVNSKRVQISRLFLFLKYILSLHKGTPNCEDTSNVFSKILVGLISDQNTRSLARTMFVCFFCFGATAPSGPWPSHSQGF
jgi:hypothetical protein